MRRIRGNLHFKVWHPRSVLTMEEALLKFKGADWVGMIFGLIATFKLAKERRPGFIYGMIGGIGWVRLDS